jgi:DNA-binding transcriptional LysR family regulator
VARDTPRAADGASVRCSSTIADRPKVRLRNLRDTPLILFETGFALNRIILDACRREGFEPTVVARSSQIHFIVKLANAGLGVAFVPRMIETQRTSEPIRILPLGVEWALAMAWRRGAFLSPACEAWLALLRETRNDEDAR